MDKQIDVAEQSHHFKWGYLRLFLGILQTSLVIAAVWMLVSVGLRPATWVLIVAATSASPLSRYLYRGKSDPRLKD